MKVILIEEERFRELTHLLEGVKTETTNNGYLKKQTGLTDDQIKFAADELFRRFNHVFVRWAQSHGASCN